MIHITDVTGLAGNAVAIVAVCMRLPGVSRLRPAQLAWLLGAVVAAELIPFDGLPLAAYLRGAIGDLSIPSLVLLLTAISRQLRGHRPAERGSSACGDSDRRTLLALLVIAALVLYPMALGWGLLDSYRLGYGSPWFLCALAAVALAALFWRATETVAVIALAVLAWSAGWYESSNLWDYLIDPLVAIYSLGALARSWVLRPRLSRSTISPT